MNMFGLKIAQMPRENNPSRDSEYYSEPFLISWPDRKINQYENRHEYAFMDNICR